jgi:hypothetical protein
VGKKYGSKGYPQGNAAHMGSIFCVVLEVVNNLCLSGIGKG